MLDIASKVAVCELEGEAEAKLVQEDVMQLDNVGVLHLQWGSGFFSAFSS